MSAYVPNRDVAAPLVRETWLSALLYFGLANRKSSTNNIGTPMNADKTWINADKTGILSAWVADCAVQPMIDVKGGLAFRKWAETSGSQNPKRSQSCPQFIRFYPRSSASLYFLLSFFDWPLPKIEEAGEASNPGPRCADKFDKMAP